MEIRKIPLSLVAPSPMNPRKTFDEGELQELADNIEKQGLLQPITVRPIADKKHFAVVDGNAGFHPEYEIICGERRFRAVSKLSEKWSGKDVTDADGQPVNHFSEISAIVREMNDEEAFDAMITENLQRKDVDPIEEAFAFGQLIQKGKTAEEVAARFGKSVRFVQDRIKLNNLIPELMLAVREDKMSLSAAMLIAKLNEEDQKKYHSLYASNYAGYTKSNAKSFVNDLFMNVDKALWYQSDNQADEDFDGGCGHKCSECQLNTASHGCLFWEMKSHDAGRCTDREKFQAKTLAYMLREIDQLADNLVKAGEPLEFGKTVLCLREGCISANAETAAPVARLREALADRGYEVVDPDVVFKSRCFYDLDDERVLSMLKSGEAYRCLDLWNWNTPRLQHERWYVKKGDAGTNVGKDGTPYQVTEILNSLKNEENGLKSSLAVAGAEALSQCTPSDEPLSEEERVMLITCMCTNNFMLAQKLGMTTSQSTDSINLHKFLKEHPEKWAMAMRGWMFQQIDVHANLRVAESMLDVFAEKNCPESFRKSREKVQAKFDKKKAKAEKQLRDLGYGLDGKPLVVTKSVSVPIDSKTVKKQFKAMKAKHPDAILIFRIGDFYQIFNEDAEVAAPLLSLTLAPWHLEPNMNQCGFTAKALDTCIPKLVRAGKRVAICEQLEEPKNKSDKEEKEDSNFPSIEFVEKKREEFPNSLLLFHVGEYYECYDQDAEDLDMDGGIPALKNETKWGHDILVNRFHENERDKVLALLKESDLNPQLVEEPK